MQNEFPYKNERVKKALTTSLLTYAVGNNSSYIALSDGYTEDTIHIKDQIGTICRQKGICEDIVSDWDKQYEDPSNQVTWRDIDPEE